MSDREPPVPPAPPGPPAPRPLEIAPESRRITIKGRLHIDERDLSEEFIRASGPGGQNVNKVSTAVQLRFQLDNNRTLPDDVKQRAGELAGSRLTQAGEILIQADRFRTREQNREDALARLIELLVKAAHRDKPRKATRPTLASKKRRLDTKKQRGGIKKLRSGRPDSD